VISAIRSTRSDINVPAAAIIPLRLKEAGGTTRARIERYRGLIERLARVDATNPEEQRSQGGAARIALDEMTIVLPLAGIIDLGVELARLEKESKRLAGELDRIDKKLDNPQFMERAPEEVIAELRERRIGYGASADKVLQAIEMLKS
jgi:valyl-tRNA synthetase